METDEQFMSRLDRDGHYRICALNNAVSRAAQDGGIEGQTVDVLGLAETYYAWLKGNIDIQTPIPEIEKP